MNIFKHPCNSCLIKPICKEPECFIVKDHYIKIDGKIKVTHVLISTFLFVFVVIPFLTYALSLTPKDFNHLDGIFYLSCVIILFVLTIFIIYKEYIRRMNELNRIDKFFFKKVKE